MPLSLRPYQLEVVNDTISQLRKTSEPVIVVASVSSGKTFMVSGLMEIMERNGRSSLCLSMTAELIDQNSECYADFVGKCSVFCASLGKKNYKLASVFATPQTVWSAIKKGHDIGKRFFDLLVVDECHSINSDDDKSTYMMIIAHYMAINPNMRIVGLTGTPFRGKGFSIVGDDKFFKHQTADISLKWLTDNKFVVPLVYTPIEAEHYDFSNVKMQSNGKFNAKDLAVASEGKGRLTSEIIAEVVKNSQTEGGVIIFASTVAHCKEIMESLPHGISAMVTGETSEKDRLKAIKQIKSGEIKYIVNVSVLLTGFSAPYISHVVWMRPTESVVLWVQGNGRAVRMADNKTHALVSDYAGNLDRLGDVDDPMIIDAVKASYGDAEKEVPCPECDELNTIHARRCVGYSGGHRCEFYFSFSECESCGTKNDATSRNCRCCGIELIDPNEKLSRTRSMRITSVPVRVPVINTQYTRHKKTGKVDSLRVDYMVKLPNEKSEIISEWFSPDGSGYGKVLYEKEFVSKHAPELSGATLDDVLSSKQLIKSPEAMLIHRKVNDKYLSIVLKEFA